jgi:predicted RNase H-like HicB family nuclease
MHNEFTAIIEQDEEWFIAYSPEIPGANGQGRSSEEARTSLGEAIALILEVAGEPVGALASRAG